MQNTVLASCAALLLGSLTLAACVSDAPSPSDSDAGSAGVSSGGSASGVAGSAASSGSSVGSAGSQLGSGGKADAQNQAGASAAGAAAGGTTGSAGGAPGGSGGSAGSASGSAGSGGKVPPNPSSGCNKANPATGTSGMPLTVSGHQYYVKLPTNYDASKPYPVLMMFNPTGNPISWAEGNAGFEMTGPKEAWIRAYPTMANNGNGWGASDVAFFEPFYEQLIASYCIDKARVFAAGESSGGDFASILGCEHGDKLRATAPCSTKPVTGYDLTVPTKRQCKGELSAVVIQGKNDNVVGPANGPKTRDFYAALNHCGATTTPVPKYTDTLSNCVMYEGCDAGFPVYWCNHTDPNYSNTNHGWPAFANKFLWELFSSY
jgi:poly(3-hydroxybutyrate) depolymerase